ncbi:chromosome partitioning protein [Cryobacterium sp. PH31-O1]|uniref:MinD/ParA family ATP-binding protein n=1 Tax=Cryobacterium sp. PH31-O1 TaxID=3046306 RepID=UPI0024B943B8|nr:chromosome partitioning protein [Cryobacterium sp. PH31-O1]MDJ0338659.1 chromosome partitioning protein [Cryobacterium sp. PH31-O1]
MSPDVPALTNTTADIVAAVHTDTTGEVTIDGARRRVTGTDEAGVREEIIGLVVETARSRGQSVLLQVSDEQGDWPLTVHPNGRVESAGPVIASRPQPASTAPLPVVPDRQEPTPFAALLQPPLHTPASALFESLLAPTAAAVPTAAAAPTAASPVAPNLADFLSSRPPAPAGPAERGWQGALRRFSGGLISPTPSSSEQKHRNAVSAVQRSLNGPRTIVVLNPKGGAHKTTATLLIAATFGIYRGGYTLAWDNNETMGTLGVRAQAARHTNTAVDLLRDLDRFGDARSRVGDLDNYVRSQGDAQFDALASDLDPAGAASIDDDAFRKLHTTLSRFYRVLVIDTGNNMRASNWEAAVDTADQLVIVSTIREDTGYGAASLIDGLRQKGHADKVAQAVTVLASPSKTADEQLSKRLHDHFRQLTRTVVDVPYDASLVGGGPLNVDALAPRTRAAWLQATAAIAEGL